MIPAAFAPQASHLWQSTVFAALAGLLTLALRRNQARVRYWIWLAASYKFLLPFSWLVSIGHRFEWRAAPAIMPPVVSAVTDAISGPIFLTALPAAEPASDRLPVLLLVIWAVWACGFVVVTAGWAREWLRIRAIVLAAFPLALGLPIRVVSTSARLEPGVFGIFRPVLLLPEDIAARLTQAQLQAVIAHELCHVRRRDNLAAAIHMLVEALFWFHPLVWWLGARIIDERERACDEAVLQSGSEAQVYAESILKVCEFYVESPLTCVSGISGSDLKKRLKRIMKQHSGIALTARKKVLLASAAVVALTAPLVAGVLTAPIKLQSAADRTPKVKVGTITFQGNTVFSNRQLIRTMRNSRPYSIPMFLFDIPLRSKTFDRSKLNEDLKDGVRRIYQSNGYFKVLVKDPILTTGDAGKTTNITIPIKEGSQYRMGRLVIHSTDPAMAVAIKRDVLETKFPLKQGDIFDVDKVRMALSDYNKIYSNFTAIPDTNIDRVAKTIDLTFEFVAKSQASLGADRPKFEVVSLKTHESGVPPENPGGFSYSEGVWKMGNVSLRTLMAVEAQHFFTYGRLIFDAPAWVDSERFEIAIRTDEKPVKEQASLIVRSLLNDRFKLTMHHETRQVQVYALEVLNPGKLGPRLTPHSDEAKCSVAPLKQPGPGDPMPACCEGVFMAPRPGDLRETGNKINMELLSEFWSQSVDRMIVDRTGLSGFYDFSCEFAPDLGFGAKPSGTTMQGETSAVPSIFTAAQEQLGLKLEPQTASVDVLVIDHVEQPSPN